MLALLVNRKLGIGDFFQTDTRPGRGPHCVFLVREKSPRLGLFYVVLLLIGSGELFNCDDVFGTIVYVLLGRKGISHNPAQHRL